MEVEPDVRRVIEARWRGLVPYREALEQQLAWREQVWEGAPQQIWGLEHPPVITLGKRGGEVRGDAEAAGYEVVATNRGGLATCHEPGQLVVYLVVDAAVLGIRVLVERVEDGVLAWLAGEGLQAGRREGLPGIWVGPDKVCAVGFNVRRGVTTHGIALNLVNSLAGFALISPCGIEDGGVTSVQRVLGRAPTPTQAWPSLADALRSRLAP